MIFNAVIRFFKAVFGFIVKALAWLLFILGLWLPCLYLVIFLIVCALTQTSVSSVVSTLVVGLVFSFIGGVAISYYIDKAKRARKQVVRRKKNEPSPVRIPVRSRDDGEDEAKQTPRDSGEYYDNESDRDRDGYYAEDREDRGDVCREERGSGDRDGYYAEQRAQNREESSNDESTQSYNDESRQPGSAGEKSLLRESRPEFQSYNAPAPEEKKSELLRDNSGAKPSYDFATEARLRGKYFEDENKSRLDSSLGYDYEKAAAKRLDGIMNGEEETPMVFRSRADKDIYIREYSNRLEYYLRMPTGEMRLLDIRYRQRDNG